MTRGGPTERWAQKAGPRRYHSCRESPFRRWMLCDIEVDELTAVMDQHDEYEQDSQSKSRHRKEIHRHELAYMVVQKRLPSLGRIPRPSGHPARNRSLRNVEAQLQQFPHGSSALPTADWLRSSAVLASGSPPRPRGR